MTTDMTAMTGTEKQIACAATIRENAIAHWNAVIAERQAEDAEYWAPMIADAQAIIDRAATVTQAAAWIDAKSRNGANPWMVIAAAGTNWSAAARELGMDAAVYRDTADQLA